MCVNNGQKLISKTTVSLMFKFILREDVIINCKIYTAAEEDTDGSSIFMPSPQNDSVETRKKSSKEEQKRVEEGGRQCFHGWCRLQWVTSTWELVGATANTSPICCCGDTPATSHPLSIHLSAATPHGCPRPALLGAKAQLPHIWGSKHIAVKTLNISCMKKELAFGLWRENSLQQLSSNTSWWPSSLVGVVEHYKTQSTMFQQCVLLPPMSPLPLTIFQHN